MFSGRSFGEFAFAISIYLTIPNFFREQILDREEKGEKVKSKRIWHEKERGTSGSHPFHLFLAPLKELPLDSIFYLPKVFMSFDSFFVTLCDFLDSESPTFGNQMVPSEGSRGSEGESDVFLSNRVEKLLFGNRRSFEQSMTSWKNWIQEEILARFPKRRSLRLYTSIIL